MKYLLFQASRLGLFQERSERFEMIEMIEVNWNEYQSDLNSRIKLILKLMLPPKLLQLLSRLVNNP
jgi:hypothetical protein